MPYATEHKENTPIGKNTNIDIYYYTIYVNNIRHKQNNEIKLIFTYYHCYYCQLSLV